MNELTEQVIAVFKRLDEKNSDHGTSVTEVIGEMQKQHGVEEPNRVETAITAAASMNYITQNGENRYFYNFER